MPERHIFSVVALAIGKALAWFTIGGLVSLLTLFIFYMEGQVDLSIWHKVNLEAEFTTNSKVQNFADYLSIENRLFNQLDQLVVDHVPVNRINQINRYSRGSLSDPAKWSRNWNRTFELPSQSPRAGILLLHGMSDSPYSLRKIGQHLHKKDAWVLGLRFPGHGTAPSGLTDLRWQDMARAVELAMNHLRKKVGEQPIYIIGYSAGGALAVQYALTALSDEKRPVAEGIVLISPAIGVTSLAAFAVWQARLGAVLGLDKLEWTDIKLEYDPYKYNSFAVNAGDQVYRLTREISRLLATLGKSGDLDKFPPLLAFQSSTDATVSSRALVQGLLTKLSSNHHKLILFDINRQEDIEAVLREDPKQTFSPLLTQSTLPFSLSVVTNRNNHSRAIHILHKPEGSTDLQSLVTELSWPEDINSLSHVSLPFSENDTVYGNENAPTQSQIHLGNIALRGERGVLRITPSDMLRLRWNPFYSIVERQIEEFMQID